MTEVLMQSKSMNVFYIIGASVMKGKGRVNRRVTKLSLLPIVKRNTFKNQFKNHHPIVKPSRQNSKLMAKGISDI